jgi:hypothetical protein
MTFYQFNALDEMEQAEALWNRSVHIAQRDDEVYRYVLYQLEGFYVEVWLHREHNFIQRFCTFRSADQLDPYIDTSGLPPDRLGASVAIPEKQVHHFSLPEFIIHQYRLFFKVPSFVPAGAVWFRFVLFMIVVFILGLLVGGVLIR